MSHNVPNKMGTDAVPGGRLGSMEQQHDNDDGDRDDDPEGNSDRSDQLVAHFENCAPPGWLELYGPASGTILAFGAIPPSGILRHGLRARRPSLGVAMSAVRERDLDHAGTGDGSREPPQDQAMAAGSTSGGARDAVHNPDTQHSRWRCRWGAVDGLTGRDRGRDKYLLDAVQLA